MLYANRYVPILKGIETENEKRIAKRKENREALQQWADSRAAKGQSLSMLDMMTYLEDVSGEDGYWSGYNPNQRIIEGMRLTQNTEAENTRRKNEFARLDQEMREQDMMVGFAENVGSDDPTTIKNALTKKFDYLGDNNPMLDTVTRKALENISMGRSKRVEEIYTAAPTLKELADFKLRNTQFSESDYKAAETRIRNERDKAIKQATNVLYQNKDFANLDPNTQRELFKQAMDAKYLEDMTSVELDNAVSVVRKMADATAKGKLLSDVGEFTSNYSSNLEREKGQRQEASANEYRLVAMQNAKQREQDVEILKSQLKLKGITPDQQSNLIYMFQHPLAQKAASEVQKMIDSGASTSVIMDRVNSTLQDLPNITADDIYRIEDSMLRFSNGMDLTGDGVVDFEKVYKTRLLNPLIDQKIKETAAHKQATVSNGNAADYYSKAAIRGEQIFLEFNETIQDTIDALKTSGEVDLSSEEILVLINQKRNEILERIKNAEGYVQDSQRSVFDTFSRKSEQTIRQYATPVTRRKYGVELQAESYLRNSNVDGIPRQGLEAVMGNRSADRTSERRELPPVQQVDRPVATAPRDKLESLESPMEKQRFVMGELASRSVPKDLIAIAMLESGLDPDAKAKTSSAKGLWQFIDKTESALGFEKGSLKGMGRIEDQIAAINKLTSENVTRFENNFGRKPDIVEKYMMHFLGAGGAIHMFRVEQSGYGNQPLRNFLSNEVINANKDLLLFKRDDGSYSKDTVSFNTLKAKFRDKLSKAMEQMERLGYTG